jgi:FAD/FMN-containing dehydrogenase
MLNRRQFFRSSLAAAVAASLPGARAWPAILSPTMRVDRDLEAVTGDGASVTLARAAVQELGLSLRGNLLLPGHAAYEEARRVINAQMNKHPALIVQPRGAADVKYAVDFARGSNLLVAVKCGGHSPSGKSTCDGGLMIDLSLMRGVRVDSAARVAHVAGGSLLGDLDHESMAFGLATTAGTVSHTGVGGLTLGGGFGRLARRFGLALDNVRAVDVVTAAGELVHASAVENADLYWGVRGGGGNFGVVTSFEFELHPMQREVIGGFIAFPFSQAKQVLSFYSEFEAMAPDELYISGALGSNPQGGLTGAGFEVCYSGPMSRADEILRTIRSAGTPIFDQIRAIDYVALQKSGEDRLRRADLARADRRDDQRVRGASRAHYHDGLPALRRRDQPRGRRCDRVPAPEHPRDGAVARRLAGRDRPDPAHRLAKALLGHRRAAYGRLLYERRRRRIAAAGRRELPAQLSTPARAQEQVRPDEPVPLECQYRADRMRYALDVTPNKAIAQRRVALRSLLERRVRDWIASPKHHGHAQ